MTKEDLEIDVIPCDQATKEIVEARKTFYYANMELAQTQVLIITKTEMLNEYRNHIKQQFEKEAKPISDTMIYEKLKAVKALQDLNDNEKTNIAGIDKDLARLVGANKETRLELYETLCNILLQHGK